MVTLAIGKMVFKDVWVAVTHSIALLLVPTKINHFLVTYSGKSFGHTYHQLGTKKCDPIPQSVLDRYPNCNSIAMAGSHTLYTIHGDQKLKRPANTTKQSQIVSKARWFTILYVLLIFRLPPKIQCL